MKIFISHKQEDALAANQMATQLREMKVDYYLDLLDSSVVQSGKELTNHIRRNLNNCTDIIVIMSKLTRFSQWVPFEVGMAAQIDMPTATFLQEDVSLPDFLQYWPRNYVDQEYEQYRSIFESATYQKPKTERFYEVLKQRLE